MNKKEEEGTSSNPGHVTSELCAAYRSTVEEKIKGVRDTIIVGLSISTSIIAITMYLLKVGGMS